MAKHARAEAVRVRVTAGPDRIEVEIVDDGGGFDPEQRADGFGLLGMHERAALVGGHLRIESSAAGTILRGSFPHFPACLLYTSDAADE